MKWEHLTLVMLLILLPCQFALVLLRQGRHRRHVHAWLECSLECALMQEFPERVRICKRNCETVRRLNAVKKEGYKVSRLPFFAFIDARPQVLPRSAFYVPNRSLRSDESSPLHPGSCVSTHCTWAQRGLPNTSGWQYQR